MRWIEYFYTISDAIIEIVGDSVDGSSAVSGPPDKFYNPGSHITLKCIIRDQILTIGKYSKTCQKYLKLFSLVFRISFRHDKSVAAYSFLKFHL